METALKHSTNQRDDFFQSPDVIGDARFHRGRDAQRGMNTAKVVVHEVNRGGVFVVFKLLAECVREPGKAAVAHAQREVLPFNVACGNKAFVRSSTDATLARSNANGRRI